MLIVFIKNKNITKPQMNNNHSTGSNSDGQAAQQTVSVDLTPVVDLKISTGPIFL